MIEPENLLARDRAKSLLGWWRRYYPTALGALGWLAAIIVGIHVARATIGRSATGMDMWPVRDAGLAVLDGRPIYDVPMYVDMPTAALVGVVLSLLSLHHAIVLCAYGVVAIVASSVFLFGRCLRPSRWALLGSALIAVALLNSDLVERVARLENLDSLLVLPCLGMVYFWGTGRWRLGALLFALTLVLKPMLIALLIVPLVARKWRAAGLAIAVTVSVTLASLPMVRSLSSAVHVADKVLRGSNLTGSMAVFNQSLWGVSQEHHVSQGLVLTGRLIVVVVAIACALSVWRQDRAMTVAVVGPLVAVLLDATFLAGSLSENHYLIVLLPATLTCLMQRNIVARVLVAAAGLLAAYSPNYTTILGGPNAAVPLQFRLVSIEVLIFAAAVSAVLYRDQSRSLTVRAPSALTPADTAASAAKLSAPGTRQFRKRGSPSGYPLPVGDMPT